MTFPNYDYHVKQFTFDIPLDVEGETFQAEEKCFREKLEAFLDLPPENRPHCLDVPLNERPHLIHWGTFSREVDHHPALPFTPANEDETQDQEAVPAVGLTVECLQRCEGSCLSIYATWHCHSLLKTLALQQRPSLGQLVIGWRALRCLGGGRGDYASLAQTLQAFCNLRNLQLHVPDEHVIALLRPSYDLFASSNASAFEKVEIVGCIEIYKDLWVTYDGIAVSCTKRFLAMPELYSSMVRHVNTLLEAAPTNLVALHLPQRTRSQDVQAQLTALHTCATLRSLQVRVGEVPNGGMSGLCPKSRLEFLALTFHSHHQTEASVFEVLGVVLQEQAHLESLQVVLDMEMDLNDRRHHAHLPRFAELLRQHQSLQSLDFTNLARRGPVLSWAILKPLFAAAGRSRTLRSFCFDGRLDLDIQGIVQGLAALPPTPSLRFVDLGSVVDGTSETREPAKEKSLVGPGAQSFHHRYAGFWAQLFPASICQNLSPQQAVGHGAVDNHDWQYSPAHRTWL